MEDSQVIRLVTFGVSKIDRLNDVLDEADDLRSLNDEEMAVAVICFAASLAKLTKLDLVGLLQIMTNAYQNIDISKKERKES